MGEELAPVPEWVHYWVLGIFIYFGVMAIIGLVNFYLHADRKMVAQIRRESNPFNRHWVMFQSSEKIYSERGLKVFQFLTAMLYGLFFLVFAPIFWIHLFGG